MRIKNGQDMATAVMFIAIGFMAIWIGADYPRGTPQRPGTGVLPLILAWCLVGTGVILLVQAFLKDLPGFGAGLLRAALIVGLTTAATLAVIFYGPAIGVSAAWGVVPVCLGSAVLLQALEMPIAWQPFLMVLLATMAFGLMIDDFGLIITMIVSLTLCALGTPETRWREYLGFLAIMIALGYSTFVWLLGMPIPTWPTPKLLGLLFSLKS